jgi:hypothetical protein
MLELFVVMIEYKHQGFPLAYLFLENAGAKGYQVTALQRTLQRVSNFVRLITFLTDKDAAQISAIESVFPSAKVQLCYFHVIQAIERACKKSFKWSQGNVSKYAPHRSVVSHLTGIPDGQFPSLTKSGDEFVPKDVRNELLELIRIHFNRHPMIPYDISQEYWTGPQIYQACVPEAFLFCRTHKLPLT